MQHKAKAKSVAKKRFFSQQNAIGSKSIMKVKSWKYNTQKHARKQTRANTHILLRLIQSIVSETMWS